MIAAMGIRSLLGCHPTSPRPQRKTLRHLPQKGVSIEFVYASRTGELWGEEYIILSTNMRKKIGLNIHAILSHHISPLRLDNDTVWSS